MSITHIKEYLNNLTLSEKDSIIADQILKN